MTEQGPATERLRVIAVETAKLVGATAFSALFFAPTSAEYALETTTVETHVAEFPTELAFRPGSSKVSLLNQADIYVDKTRAGIGVEARVTG